MRRNQIYVPGLDDVVWAKLRLMRSNGHETANAGELWGNLRKKLRRIRIGGFRAGFDVVAVLGLMLGWAELNSNNSP